MRYVGVDGYSGGWVAVCMDGEQIETDAFATIDALWAAYRDAALILIDMPIGLPDGRRTKKRICDEAAKRELGPRSASIFPAPCRGLLQTATYDEANSRTREWTGQGLSKQSFNLVPKIRELDAFLQTTPEARRICRESHPELCFRMLAGSPLRKSKKDASGVLERIEIISRLVPSSVQRLPKAMRGSLDRLDGVRPDDLLDAWVLAVSAQLSAGSKLTPVSLPAEYDETGLPMEIVYYDFLRRSISSASSFR